MSLVLAPAPSGVPTVVHWGADLGKLDDDALAALLEVRRPGVPHSALDAPRFLGVVPESGSGFTGTPALEGHRPDDHGRPWAPSLRDWSWQVDDAADGDDATVRLTGRDEEAGWEASLELRLTREGLVRMRTTATNTAPSDWSSPPRTTCCPPGRRPPRCSTSPAAGAGSGRPSAARGAGHPTCGRGAAVAPGTTPPCSSSREHRGSASAPVRCAASTWRGAVTLATGDGYTTPWLVGSWSAEGLDPMSHRLHAWVRRHSPRARRPRPVLLNTWEAAYFDHDLERCSTCRFPRRSGTSATPCWRCSTSIPSTA